MSIKSKFNHNSKKTVVPPGNDETYDPGYIEQLRWEAAIDGGGKPPQKTSQKPKLKK